MGFAGRHMAALCDPAGRRVAWDPWRQWEKAGPHRFSVACPPEGRARLRPFVRLLRHNPIH